MPWRFQHFSSDAIRSKLPLAFIAIAASPWNAAWPQTASPRPLLDQYCVGCHNQKNATAGVALSGIDLANAVGAHIESVHGLRFRHREGVARAAGFSLLPLPHGAVPAGQRAERLLDAEIEVRERFRCGRRR